MQSEFDDFLCAGITYLMNRHKCTSFNNNKEAEGGNGNGGLFVKRTVLYSVHIIYLAHAHCCAGDAVILVYIYVNIYSI